MAREIYSEYTDKIEPYGIDEAWLDVSDSRNLKGSGIMIAREISHRIKYELGVTVSIGISWNKIYAKLGSDYKKPDAITEFNRENYKSMIWQLPASDLLYVGRQTRKKLQKLGIRTIGELAESDETMLESHFGKMGIVLWSFANGWDNDPVCKDGYAAPVKSIGNSTTTPRDLEDDLDVWIIQMALAESVAARLRKHGFKCKTIEITVRDNGLFSFSRQKQLHHPTNITDEIVTAAFQLFKDHYKWEYPIRSLGIRAVDLVLDDIPVQLELFGNQEKQEKLEKMDRTVDEIRRRFGYFSIQRAVMLCIRIKSYPTWTLVHIRFIHTVIFMDNGRDRFETDINQKTGRKLSVYFELYKRTWISADSPGIWKTDRSKINVICFFQNQAVRAKRIYPKDSGIATSN